MRLLFFTKMNFALSGNSGIYKKVKAQKKAFEQLGVETDLLIRENNYIKLISDKNPQAFPFPSGILGSIKKLRFNFSGILSKINIKNYDFVFIRHFPAHPLFMNMLAKMKSQNPRLKIFMEIPTFPYQFEFQHMGWQGRIKNFMDSNASKSFFKYIDYIVTFSKKDFIYKIPTIKTANGIDPETIAVVQPPLFEKQLDLLGLANLQVWHGYDRIIKGLKKHYENPNARPVHFHIVGEGAEYEPLQNLTKKLNLNKYVTFYGYQRGTALDAFFEKCHLGIGSIGMHRINVAKGETSTLKAREFTARGMPFVIGYDDRDFAEDYPYLLEIEGTDQSADIDKIYDFYINLKPNFTQAMRNYAEERLSWKSKLTPVVGKMKTGKA